MQFEWSEEKEAENLQKHHLSLKQGRYVFNDPFRKERHDDDSSIEEERYQTIGLVNHVLFVVFTERGENIRLISTRLAEPKERRIYYGDDLLDTQGWRPANG
jgi:uncharacterized DUF497 family protein